MFRSASRSVPRPTAVALTPSSSHDDSIQEDSDSDTENVDIAQRPTKTRHTEGSKKVSTGEAVAAKLHMDCVTPRAIAYATVQVGSFQMTSWHHILICLKLVLALSDALGWCFKHNDLNFHDLYNLVIDFFENVRNPTKKAKRQDLLKWWNKYVIHI